MSPLLETEAESPKPSQDKQIPQHGDDRQHAVLADCLAFLKQQMPDLAAVLEAWSNLPDPIRTAIVAIVETTGSNPETPTDRETQR